MSMETGIETETEIVEVDKVKKSFLRRYFTKKIKMVIAILVLIIAIGIGVKSYISFDSKTLKIGFENIGELATQSAYCTELGIIDDSRKFNGLKIPFTQSNYIYSCDIVIKAGFNFEDISWKENGTTIEVELPEAKILSSDIDLDSFKIYQEDESVFNQITMTETNESMKVLQVKAEEDAVANGLLKNARANVEVILKGFFGRVYDWEKYEIVFKDK